MVNAIYVHHGSISLLVMDVLKGAAGQEKSVDENIWSFFFEQFEYECLLLSIDCVFSYNNLKFYDP